ncbi:hypothetical protein LEP1GSC062_1293 [Leptospira alexanderi serovar Manhao 3 str. L 60]|uniref:Uncharacterized protein n=1 Tax=Leptospira alexanderi serovar Manhao 3 str. L 60 TaxID=1049759 RepID=V6I5R1_9LEPT|nr:hypothetical protein LEP1GSC062_1293 [Leptospira alexanderi serovar Manhao 3 str. L 60]
MNFIIFIYSENIIHFFPLRNQAVAPIDPLRMILLKKCRFAMIDLALMGLQFQFSTCEVGYEPCISKIELLKN